MRALGKNLAYFSHIYNRHYRKEILSLPVVQLLRPRRMPLGSLKLHNRVEMYT
jgi:hypothetical protein